MAESILSAPHFHNEEAAYEFVEARIWSRGPVCPHCGGVERNSKMGGKSTRIGTYKCYDCRKPFTVKIGTIFEASHIPMRLWLQAIFLIASSKKGISSNQLHRTLGITLKSAWFMSHRIREAMKAKGEKRGRGFAHKHKVVTLIDRGIGHARSVVLDSLKGKEIRPYLAKNIREDSRILTDEAGQYRYLRPYFDQHYFTRHSAGE